MAYAVICPDDVDRLHTQWYDVNQAAFDAAYFSRRTPCDDWSGIKGCPGGIHTFRDPMALTDDPELPLAWAVDVPT